MMVGGKHMRTLLILGVHHLDVIPDKLSSIGFDNIYIYWENSTNGKKVYQKI
jgi:hypothetical protein